MYRGAKVEDCSLYVRKKGVRMMGSHTWQAAIQNRVDMEGLQEKTQPTIPLQSIPSSEEKEVVSIDLG